MNDTLTPITVETTINAPIAHVWQCWTEPGHITRWCQASPDWHAPYAANDVQAGGKFKTTMAAKDGSMSFDFEGVYDSVTPNSHMAYSMADGRRVQVWFTETDGTTQVKETFDPENQNPVEMQQAGWQAILDSFKNYTEAAVLS